MTPHAPGTCLRHRTRDDGTLTVIGTRADAHTLTYLLRDDDGFLQALPDHAVRTHYAVTRSAAHRFTLTLGGTTIEQTIHAAATLGPRELHALHRNWAYAQITGTPLPTP